MQAGNPILIALILTGLANGVAAQTTANGDTNDSKKTIISISDALDSADHHPIHILYVHGINQIGAGDSALLRTSICTELKLCAVADWKNAGVEFADEGEFAPNVQPPTIAYLGSPVWSNAGEWHAAAPFVVHWVIHLRHHPAVLVLDEINWWPLVMALKCRRIVAPESYLAGPDQKLLQVCSQASAQDPDGQGRFYPWISPSQAATLAKVRPRGALANRALKDDLIDWGLSDALLSVGPMNGILRDGLRQLMAKSAAFDPNLAAQSSQGAAPSPGNAQEKYDWRAQLSHDNTMDQEFIGVTHSLGSYLLFNTLNPESAAAATPEQAAQQAARVAAENSAMQYIFERTSQIYFFANQLEMLEITNLESPPGAPAVEYQSRGLAPPPSIPTSPAENFRALVARWEQFHSNFQAALHPSDAAAREKLQIVAWSDASDIFTWRVPRLGDVDVVNLYVQNGKHWLGLFESPSSAHADYARNKAVLRVLFPEAAHSASGN